MAAAGKQIAMNRTVERCTDCSSQAVAVTYNSAAELTTALKSEEKHRDLLLMRISDNPTLNMKTEVEK